MQGSPKMGVRKGGCVTRGTDDAGRWDTSVPGDVG